MIEFSVLLSVYAKENPTYFQQALESVWQTSTMKPKQIVLVEDGKLTLELYNVVSSFQKKVGDVLTVVDLEHNHGLSAALNIGLQYVITDLVARMDTDDICHENRFERQINYLESHPDIDIIGTYAYKINDAGNVMGQMTVPIKDEDIRRKIWTCPFIHPTVMFRKERILKVGGYNPNAGPRQDDYDLWFRCAFNDFHFANIPEPLFYYRFNDNNVRRNSIKVGWYRFKVGYKGCRKLHLSLFAHIGVAFPLIRALLPYPLNVYFNKLMVAFNPRSK